MPVTCAPRTTSAPALQHSFVEPEAREAGGLEGQAARGLALALYQPEAGDRGRAQRAQVELERGEDDLRLLAQELAADGMWGPRVRSSRTTTAMAGNAPRA
jgi:hypothetical protein